VGWGNPKSAREAAKGAKSDAKNARQEWSGSRKAKKTRGCQWALSLPANTRRPASNNAPPRGKAGLATNHLSEGGRNETPYTRAPYGYHFAMKIQEIQRALEVAPFEPFRLKTAFWTGNRYDASRATLHPGSYTPAR
jgi:hypothetical protein